MRLRFRRLAARPAICDKVPATMIAETRDTLDDLQRRLMTLRGHL
jgi:hypothetical protein